MEFDALAEFNIIKDALFEHSIILLRNSKFRTEFINDTSIDSYEKINDFDEMLQWAIDHEMYEDCAILVEMKESLIETIDIQSLIQ